MKARSKNFWACKIFLSIFSSLRQHTNQLEFMKTYCVFSLCDHKVSDYVFWRRFGVPKTIWPFQKFLTMWVGGYFLESSKKFWPKVRWEWVKKAVKNLEPVVQNYFFALLLVQVIFYMSEGRISEIFSLACDLVYYPTKKNCLKSDFFGFCGANFDFHVTKSRFRNHIWSSNLI